MKGARTLAKEALNLATTGVDPAEQKRQQRDADTIATLAQSYIDKHAKAKKRSWKSDQRILDTIVLPAWKHRPANAITRRDVRELIESVNGDTYPNRVRALLSKMFQFALQRDIVDVNPVIGTPRPGVERQRDRVLTEDEIRQLWQASESWPPVMAGVFRLRLISAQRGVEVINMRWQDIALESGWWTIPSEFSKNKLPHRVPLSALALDILKALRSDVDETLQQHPQSKPPIFVLRGARGNRQRGTAAKTLKLKNSRGHDLRRTATSYMASAGVQRLVISKILNHVEQGVTAYDRHSYDAENGSRSTSGQER